MHSSKLLVLLPILVAHGAVMPAELRLNDLVDWRSCPAANLPGAAISSTQHMSIRVVAASGIEDARIEVLQSSGLADVDDAIIAAFRKCRWRDATPAPQQGDVGDLSIRTTKRGTLGDGVRPTVDFTTCPVTGEDYPIESKRKGETGSVKVELSVDEKGQPGDARVVRSSGYSRLDRLSVSKFKQCKFYPGYRVDGTGIGGIFSVTYDWKP